MAGYYRYSMSNNALEAYNRGEMPMSKWTKKAIFKELAKCYVKSEDMAIFKAMTVGQLRDRLLRSCGWHHTSKYFNQTEFYSVDYDRDENFIESIDVCDNIFKVEGWYYYEFNKRRKAFNGLSKAQFETAKKKHLERIHNCFDVSENNKVKLFQYEMRFFNEIPYVYNGDGYDDFSKYQRPSSNGKGYVAVCVGDSDNNYYTENPFVVKALKRRYAEWRHANPGVKQIPDNILSNLDYMRKYKYERWQESEENRSYETTCYTSDNTEE